MWLFSGNKRRLRLVLGLLLASAGLYGQLTPLSSQYLFNPLAINPAIAGSRDALSISILHRSQWAGFEGAPRTETLSMHTPMKNEKVGLGLMVMSDRTGIASTNLVSGSFAYRIRMTSGTLSLGLAGGLFMVRNHWDDLVAIHPDDPGIPATLDRFVYPDFSIGVNYQSNSFFAGISLPMFLTHRFNSDTHRFDLVNDFRNYNFHLQAGYLFRISTNWRILPAVMARYTPSAFPQVDLNAYMIYRNRIWVGLSYRTDHALIGLIMYQVNNQLSLAYSYDMGWGYSGRLMGGTHEIMLRYDFKYIIDVISPRFF